MTSLLASSILSVIPELVLAISAMFLLVLGAIRKEGKGFSLITHASILVLIISIFYVLRLSEYSFSGFGDMFVINKFTSYMKVLVAIGSIMSLMLCFSYLEREKLTRFEYPILVLFATLGMFMMISANSLISLYMGLEMQSLPLYVLAAIQRDKIKSSEAGLKYFVLGALASGLLLYGSSMIYGFAGTVNFYELSDVFANLETVPVGLVVGLVFVICGLGFKISAVPFHMWTPDVYEGAPTPVVAFFAIAPKVAAIALIMHVLFGPFGGLVDQWRQVIVALSVLSMTLGALAAIVQTNIKRLMAYSSIGHMGYALVGVAAGEVIGVRSVILYMLIYMMMSAGTFAVILSMRRGERYVEKISDLAGLSKTQPMLALVMTILMFSMSGIPPMAGFFGKLFIFQAAVESDMYALAVFGVLTSVVAAFYYLRIIKVMYFDESAEEFDTPIDIGVRALAYTVTAFIVCFILVPAPFVQGAMNAAYALLPT